MCGQTLWTSSEAEPSGGEAAAAPAPAAAEGEAKETAAEPAGEEPQPAAQ